MCVCVCVCDVCLHACVYTYTLGTVLGVGVRYVYIHCTCGAVVLASSMYMLVGTVCVSSSDMDTNLPMSKHLWTERILRVCSGCCLLSVP